MRATVRLRLEAGTRLPRWIRCHPKGICVTSEVVRGRRVRSLTMKGGAAFWTGHAVAVQLPGLRGMPGAIRAEKVLEISTIGPAPQLTTVVYNYHLCTECYRNTSTVVNHKPAAIAGRQEFTLRCSVCGHERTQTV